MASQKLDASTNQDLDQEQNDEVIGLAFWRSLLVLAAVACIGAGTYLLVRFNTKVEEEKRTEIVVPTYRETVATTELPAITLTDVTETSGIRFQHVNGKAGESLLPETMGGGAGFLDYDNDNDQDVLLVNSCPWPWANDDNKPTALQLYQNDGAGNFKDVTAELGLDDTFTPWGQRLAITMAMAGRISLFQRLDAIDCTRTMEVSPSKKSLRNLGSRVVKINGVVLRCGLTITAMASWTC